MYIKKLAINHALGYVLNDDSDFDGLESYSDFDEINTTRNNSDEMGANIIILNYIIWLKMRTPLFQKRLISLDQMSL